jgi:hypothetical protein
MRSLCVKNIKQEQLFDRPHVMHVAIGGESKSGAKIPIHLLIKYRENQDKRQRG